MFGWTCTNVPITLYLDDFPFFVSSLAHLEHELELFEVDDIGDDDDDDSLSQSPKLTIIRGKYRGP